jgi:hypothetical protein
MGLNLLKWMVFFSLHVLCIVHGKASAQCNIDKEITFQTIAENAIILLDENADGDTKWLLFSSIYEKLSDLIKFELTQDEIATFLPMMQFAMSPDSTFWILTGEARLAEDMYRYYGGIYHFKTKKWSELSADIYNKSSSSLGQNFQISAWTECLYYNIVTFQKSRKTYYALIGYRYEDYYRRSKHIEILSLEDGEPKFGIPLIMMDEGQIVDRYSIEYAAEAPAFFNLDELENKIVFDNLIPFKGLYEGQGVVYVPDGSYSAFEWKKGYWRYIDKLPVEPRDTPLMSNPVLDKRREKDVIGHDKLKNRKRQNEHRTP